MPYGGGLKKTETERGGIDRYETPKDLKRVDRRARQSYAALLCLAHLAAIIDGAYLGSRHLPHRDHRLHGGKITGKGCVYAVPGLDANGSLGKLRRQGCSMAA